MNKAANRGAASDRAPQVVFRADLSAPANEVWELIGSFDSLPHWHPLVAACTREREKNGSVLRHIRLHDGTPIVNRETARNDAAHSYSYELVEGPLPVVFYRSTLLIIERGDDLCTLDWASTFDSGNASEEEVKRRVESLIGPGVESLKRRFNR